MDDSAKLQQYGDELARAAGHALSAWTIIERRITGLFLSLSTVTDNNKGYLIMDAIVSFDARVKIVSELVAVSGWPKEEAAMWSALVNRIQRHQKRRNELAHFTIIHTSDGKKTKVVLAPYYSSGKAMRGEGQHLSVEDILARHAKFVELAVATAWFDDYATRQGLQPALPPLQEPHQVQELRKTAALNLAKPKQQHQSSAG